MADSMTDHQLINSHEQTKQPAGKTAELALTSNENEHDDVDCDGTGSVSGSGKTDMFLKTKEE